MQSSSPLVTPYAERLPLPPPLTSAAQVTDEDLGLFAEYLARQFGFDAVAAGLAEPAWYRERVGTDICTSGRACGLRLLTMQLCRSTHLFVPFPEPAGDPILPEKDLLQDFGREDVRDALKNRTRRGALFARTVNRVDAGVVDVSGAYDAEFDRMRLRAEFERRLSEEAEEEEGTPRPGALGFLVLLLASLLCCLWLVKRAVIR